MLENVSFSSVNQLTWISAFSAAASRSLAISWRRLCVSCSSDEMSTSLLSSSRRSGREGRLIQSSTVPCSVPSEPLLSVWPFLSAEGGTLLILSGSHTRQAGSDNSSGMVLKVLYEALHSRTITSRWAFLFRYILPITSHFYWTDLAMLAPFDPFLPSYDREMSGLPRGSSIFWKNKKTKIRWCNLVLDI